MLICMSFTYLIDIMINLSVLDSKVLVEKNNLVEAAKLQIKPRLPFHPTPSTRVSKNSTSSSCATSSSAPSSSWQTRSLRIPRGRIFLRCPSGAYTSLWRGPPRIAAPVPSCSPTTLDTSALWRPCRVTARVLTRHVSHQL